MRLKLFPVAAAVLGGHVTDTMQTGHESEGLFPQGCEPVVHEEGRRRLLLLMVEYFATIGYSDLRARLPGFIPPPVLSGTLEDHRPDFTCRQADRAKTPLILEVVTAGAVHEPGIERRWSLLASAAKLYGAELHFVLPRWDGQRPVDPALRRRLSRMELVPNRVWAV